jgi:hypothetical protein
MPTPQHPVFPAALYSGWLRRLATPAPPWLRAEGDAPAQAHPGLPAPGTAARPRLHRHGIVSALSTTDELALSRSCMAQVAEMDAAKLTPVDWSQFDADDVHAEAFPPPGPAASVLLGRAATPGDILNMIEKDGGRALGAAMLDERRRMLEDLLSDRFLPDQALWRTVTTSEILAGLTVQVLHERGYRHRDVLQPWLMTDPSGDVTDVYELTTQALESTSGMRNLRALLEPVG